MIQELNRDELFLHLTEPNKQNSKKSNFVAHMGSIHKMNNSYNFPANSQTIPI